MYAGKVDVLWIEMTVNMRCILCPVESRGSVEVLVGDRRRVVIRRFFHKTDHC